MFRLMSSKSTVEDLIAYAKTLMMTHDTTVTAMHNAYNI